MMTNLMTILERKAFISSNPRIVLSSCPPPCGHFSIQESATGGLSYKVKKGDGHPSPIQISYLFQLSNCFLSQQKFLPWAGGLCSGTHIMLSFLMYPVASESLPTVTAMHTGDFHLFPFDLLEFYFNFTKRQIQNGRFIQFSTQHREKYIRHLSIRTDTVPLYLNILSIRGNGQILIVKFGVSILRGLLLHHV